MAYYRGDYYMGLRGRAAGDYYRGRAGGDPFWGALWTGIKTVGASLLGVRPTAATVPTVGGVSASQQALANISAGLSGVRTALSDRGLVMNQPQLPPVSSLPPMIQQAGRQVFGMRPVPSHVVNGVLVPGRRRRMNPANVKALRRSIRRVVGFGRLASSARRSVSKAATALQINRRSRATTKRR